MSCLPLLHLTQRFLLLLCTTTLGLLLGAGAALAEAGKSELLLYCGITMVRPMTEIAQAFEKRENVKVTLAQGGSEDLYQAARKSGAGDLYLPGEPSYREKYLHEGLLGEFQLVGYNKLAIIVARGNPKKVKADPRELLRKDLTASIGNATSGSVGKESKDVLDQLKIYHAVVSAVAFLAPDSRGLSNALASAETLFELAHRGKVNANGQPNPLQAAVIFNDLLLPDSYAGGLPYAAQRVLFGLLAAAGKLLGYRSTVPVNGQAQAATAP